MRHPFKNEWTYVPRHASEQTEAGRGRWADISGRAAYVPSRRTERPPGQTAECAGRVGFLVCDRRGQVRPLYVAKIASWFCEFIRRQQRSRHLRPPFMPAPYSTVHNGHNAAVEGQYSRRGNDLGGKLSRVVRTVMRVGSEDAAGKSLPRLFGLFALPGGAGPLALGQTVAALASG